jgi:hypothetical protein
MDFPGVKTVADHAYWLSGIALRDGGGAAPLGTVDARSRAFGAGDPKPNPTDTGGGSLDGGNLGSLAYTSQSKSWGATPRTTRENVLDLGATNVRTVTVHPGRARLTCAARLNVKTDGLLTVTLAGCGRSVTFDKGGVVTACGSAAALRSASVRPRGRKLRIRLPARRRTTVTVYRNSRGHRVLGNRRVARRTTPRSFSWSTRKAGVYTVRLRGGGDARRFVVVRRGGRFHRRKGYARHPGCGVLRTFALNLPVFGGTTRRRLTASFRLGARRTARVTVLRGKRIVRRYRARSRRAGTTFRQRIAPRGLRRGTYTVRLTLGRRGTKTRRFTLVAQRL